MSGSRKAAVPAALATEPPRARGSRSLGKNSGQVDAILELMYHLQLDEGGLRDERKRQAYRAAYLEVWASMFRGGAAAQRTLFGGAPPPSSWEQLDPGDLFDYVKGTVNDRAQRILKEADEVRGPSARDAEAYEFVQARPRGRQRAPEWWDALLEEWKARHPGSRLRSVRGLQAAFLRGRKLAAEQHDEAHYVAALEQRAEVQRKASEELEDLAARAGLTPAMRDTLAAERLGEPVQRWQRQDLVDKLKATPKKA
ncbi:MAG TPA: hypothetical protein VGK93_08200 [Candidatus Eisenbacteria bacterium]|jgi:hypothetical protein